MKRVGIILTVLLVVLQLCSDNILARPTTRQEAEKVVNGWLKASPRPLGAALGWQVTKIQTYTDGGGSPLYYIVYLQPNGFVIVAADDLIEPIIGFVQDGIYDPSPTNPLGALVTNDLNGRVELVRSGGPVRTKAIIGVTAEPQSKWNKFIGLAEAPGEGVGTLGLPGIDDIRVDPLVQSKWSQTTCCSGPALACYNYYTPGPPGGSGDGDPANYPCGCVATALAQIMRYFQWPNTGVGTSTFDIKIRGALYEDTYRTRGGDGAGGAYNWADMVLVPDSNTTLAQRKAIGALCYDAGVGISNLVSGEYTNYYSNYPGIPITTIAYTHSAKIGLKSTFKYDNAVYGYNDGSNITDINGMVNSNLDAGLPVCFGIHGSGDIGHEVVCDGYGYNAGTPYHHLNMGWANSQDAWYNLPNINSSPTSYNTVYETIYNIYKLGDGEVISGRVTDPAGNPISDVNVNYFYPPGPSVVITHKTNAKGIYAFYGLNSDANISVWADKTGYLFGGSIITQTGKSNDSQPISGNLWGLDFECIPPDINTITPTSGPAGTYMKIEGTNFGSSPGAVVFPGGYYGDELQWSDTVILCRTSCPYSGNVCVRSSVGVDSEGVYFDATNPATIYVDVNHTPDVENGSTIYPFSTIERGMYATTYEDTVIVRPGTYNENVEFTDYWGITLTSTDPCDFNTVASTVIDGGGDGTVVTFDDDCSVLTGFTITNGFTDEYGGGIRCSGYCEETAPTISRCIITHNAAGAGGGIGSSDSSPLIDNCIITGNWAYDWWGGGIDCNNTSVWHCPTINNCIIVGNTSWGGGGISSFGNVTISHCDLSGNIAFEGGGGILCLGGDVMIDHTILWADAPAEYGQEIAMISFDGVDPVVTIAHSDVDGGLAAVLQIDGSLYWDANTIITTDPMFVCDPNPGPDGSWDDVNDNFGDLHLLVGSPCIDAGDPNYAGDPNKMDIDSQPRVVGCHIDIGADELVYFGDIEYDGDVDFVDFAIFASHWQDTNCGKCGGADFTGDGIVDFNDLAELAENWLKNLCQN